MPKLPSLDQPDMHDVMAKYPRGFQSLCDYHDAILRGPSALTAGERELIATYVSGVNNCNYCHGAHRRFAEAHGIEPDLFESLMEDPAKAGVDPKLLPILAYAKKLTQAPSTVTEEDAQKVYDAGWDEEALVTAISVTALFNFMNRLVEGTGMVANTMRRQGGDDSITNTENPTPYGDFGRMVAQLHQQRYGS